MTDQRSHDPLQRVIDFAIDRTKAWEDAAQRAELRGESSMAIYYRNQAWRIRNGREWLDDTEIREQK